MRRMCALSIALVAAMAAASAGAADGVSEINQARALAGGVTPGDVPGFPVTIDASGSYRLTGDLTAPDLDTTAIGVTADDVTIDLNGFAIIGPNDCTDPGFGPETALMNDPNPLMDGRFLAPHLLEPDDESHPQ